MARKLLGVPVDINSADDAADDQCNEDADTLTSPCPCCGARMRIIEIFKRGETPRHQPSPRPIAIRIDTS
jgi:hypothetical protein